MTTAEQFLYLTTTGWKTGTPHRIEIWFVEYEQRYYVIAEHGENAHWVQNLKHQPRVDFRVGGHIFTGKARMVDRPKEAQIAEQVSHLMNGKYGWSNGLIVELSVLGTGKLG